MGLIHILPVNVKFGLKYRKFLSRKCKNGDYFPLALSVAHDDK